jgi:protease I
MQDNDTTSKLAGKRVAILVAEGFEQIEMTSPRQALESAGATTRIVSLKTGTVHGWNHYEKDRVFAVDLTVEEARADDFDALLLPGGVANPDQIRADDNAVAFIRGFFEQHKPVAAICHGPWPLIDAEVVQGRRMTSYKSIRKDLINAGADWVDEEVVVDNGLVTSRTPEDLDAFNAKLVEEVGEGLHDGQTV